MTLSNGLFSPYILIYAIFAFAAMKQLGYLDHQSFQGWIAISILAILGILLMKPFEALALKFGKLSKVLKYIIFLENIVVLFVAFYYGHNLIVAFIGLILIVITTFIGSKIGNSAGNDNS